MDEADSPRIHCRGRVAVASQGRRRSGIWHGSASSGARPRRSAMSAEREDQVRGRQSRAMDGRRAREPEHAGAAGPGRDPGRGRRERRVWRGALAAARFFSVRVPLAITSAPAGPGRRRWSCCAVDEPHVPNARTHRGARCDAARARTRGGRAAVFSLLRARVVVVGGALSLWWPRWGRLSRPMELRIRWPAARRASPRRTDSRSAICGASSDEQAASGPRPGVAHRKERLGTGCSRGQ